MNTCVSGQEHCSSHTPVAQVIASTACPRKSLSRGNLAKMTGGVSNQDREAHEEGNIRTRAQMASFQRPSS